MKYKNNFNQIARRIRTASREAAEETAKEATNIIAKSFAEEKSGEIYSYGQASAPGEAPAINTEDLLNSLAVKRAGQSAYNFGVTDEKGEWLEFGTVKMEPRPFVAPIEKQVGRVLKKKIKEKLIFGEGK